MNKAVKVYVAGPYTSNPKANTERAIEAADWLSNAYGVTPFIPHLSHFWHLQSPKPQSFWYSYDLEFLKVCDILVRLPGDSAGADWEVRIASILRIPVIEMNTWSGTEFLKLIDEAKCKKSSK